VNQNTTRRSQNRQDLETGLSACRERCDRSAMAASKELDSQVSPKYRRTACDFDEDHSNPDGL
jgi:hypothetical protein